MEVCVCVWGGHNTQHNIAKFPHSGAADGGVGGSLLVSVCQFIIFYPQNVVFPSVLKGGGFTYTAVLGFSIRRNWSLGKKQNSV